MSATSIATLAKGGKGARPHPATRKRLVPRTLIRFSLLLSIGVAGVTVLMALLGILTGDEKAIAIVGILTMAMLMAITLILASFIILFRGLVSIGERLAAIVTWRLHGVRFVSSDSGGGVPDHWLDSPF